MSSATSTQTREPAREPSSDEPEAYGRANWLKVGIGLAGVWLLGWGLANLFLSFGYYPQWYGHKLVIALLAVIGGVAGAAAIFWFLNILVEGLPGWLCTRLLPLVYVLPAFGLICLMLVYPVLQTVNYSFANADSTAYVGLSNYREIFTEDEFQSSILNNLLWLLIVPAVTVAIGVVVAVLADKLSARGEKVAKSMIFLPMAISFVGASAIWKLVYDYRNKGENQTGLLNAAWTGLGGDPQVWLAVSDAKLNSILLMVILIWLQVGFAMILLSSAIKGVPQETLEAARIDGASELQIFWSVVVPQIKGTVITVFITVLILVLKVFDIVYVLTDGRNETNVIANLFFTELIAREQAGRASAIVVILLLAVLPVLVYQVRHFRREEAAR